MARTKTYNSFDIGVEDLLTASDEENVNFDLFMENFCRDFLETEDGNAAANNQRVEPGTIAQPVLPRVQLEFPIPPQPLRELINRPQLPIEKEPCKLRSQ